MKVRKAKAAELVTRAARKAITRNRDSVTAPASVQGSKAFAVLFYNIGAQSLEATQSAFDRHPEWEAA